MRPFYLVLLLLAAGTAGSATRLELLFVHDEARQTLTYYTESKQHAHTLPLAFVLPPANATSALASARITSRGTSLPVFFGDADAPRLVLAASGANPLWQRWRYATWDNWTLVLDNVLPAVPAAGGSATFACGQAPDVLCDAGAYRDAQGRAHRVALDPGRRRSGLSPHLYFLLSDGQAATGTTQTALHTLARATDCVELAAGGSAFRLCSRDLGGFDMLSRDAPYAVVLGAHYLAANFTQLAVDGWAGTLRATYDVQTDAGHVVYEVVGLLSAAVTAVLVYGRWVTSPQTLSMALVMRRAYGGLTRARPRYRRNTAWVLDFRFNVGPLLLTVSAGTALFAGILCFAATPAYASYPELTAFFGVLVGFAGVQYATAVALWVATDLVARRGASTAPLSEFAAPLTTAFARHAVHDAAALGFVAVALTPFMYSGVAAGSRFFLVVLLAPLLPLFFHQTYNALALLVLGLAGTAGAGPAVLAFGVWQLALAVGLLGTTTLAFLWPLVAHSSAFFPAVLDMLAAFVAMAVVVAGTAFLLSREILAELTVPVPAAGEGNEGKD